MSKSTELGSFDRVNRILMDVPLRPLQGDVFQPTKFKDIGISTFQAGETDGVLVDSHQSIGNHLEAQVWNKGQNELRDSCKGLSYVRVEQGGEFLTASTLEAHRINSVYVEKSSGDFWESFKKEIGSDKKTPINWKKFHSALFKFDVNSLIHGCFLESVDGRLRVVRAMSGKLVANGVSPARSGGVKIDHVQPGRDKGEDGNEDKESKSTAAEGFGMVPFSDRDEITANELVLYLSLDVEQIRDYGLCESATHLLILLALYKMRSMLDGSMRMRTSCDLCVKEGYDFATLSPKKVALSTMSVLPALEELEAEMKAAIGVCSKAGLFAGVDGVTTVQYVGLPKGGSKKGRKESE